MDISAYFERIGYGGSPEPTLPTLDALIAHHQAKVPFENLDIVRLNRRIEIDQEKHFQKIVEERRGGFCYELNGAMALLLEALGYHVTLGYGVWPDAEHCWTVPYDHIVLTVTPPEGRYRFLVDVGFGADSPVVAVPLVDGEERTVEHREMAAYRAAPIAGSPENWRIEQRRAGAADWSMLYEADLTPCRQNAFAARCAYLQSAPESHFTQNVICSLPLDNGRATLGGGRFILTEDGNRLERPIAGLEDELDLLKTWFSIELDPEAYGKDR